MFRAQPLARKLLILKVRRDVRVVEGARLESDPGDAHLAPPKHFLAQSIQHVTSGKMQLECDAVITGVRRRFEPTLPSFCSSQRHIFEMELSTPHNCHRRDCCRCSFWSCRSRCCVPDSWLLKISARDDEQIADELIAQAVPHTHTRLTPRDDVVRAQHAELLRHDRLLKP